MAKIVLGLVAHVAHLLHVHVLKSQGHRSRQAYQVIATFMTTISVVSEVALHARPAHLVHGTLGNTFQPYSSVFDQAALYLHLQSVRVASVNGAGQRSIPHQTLV